MGVRRWDQYQQRLALEEKISKTEGNFELPQLETPVMRILGPAPLGDKLLEKLERPGTIPVRCKKTEQQKTDVGDEITVLTPPTEVGLGLRLQDADVAVLVANLCGDDDIIPIDW